MREAATRVFSNASGSYSSNVNLAVENSSWQDESQLQEMYMQRKSFAFNSDRCARALLVGQPGCSCHCFLLSLCCKHKQACSEKVCRNYVHLVHHEPQAGEIACVGSAVPGTPET